MHCAISLDDLEYVHDNDGLMADHIMAYLYLFIFAISLSLNSSTIYGQRNGLANKKIVHTQQFQPNVYKKLR